jgi:hypothetical protein
MNSTIHSLLRLHSSSLGRLAVTVLRFRFSAPGSLRSLVSTIASININLKSNHILFFGIPGKIPLPHPPPHLEPINPIFLARRRLKFPQFLNLALFQSLHSRVSSSGSRSRVSDHSNRLLRRSGPRVTATRRLTAAEIAAEKDTESRRRGTHDPNLQLELSPDEDHEAGAHHVV